MILIQFKEYYLSVRNISFLYIKPAASDSKLNYVNIYNACNIIVIIIQLSKCVILVLKILVFSNKILERNLKAVLNDIEKSQ